MGFFSKVWSYLTFRKQPIHPDKGSNFNLRAMHTINKISLFMGLTGLLILLVRWMLA